VPPIPRFLYPWISSAFAHRYLVPRGAPGDHAKTGRTSQICIGLFAARESQTVPTLSPGIASTLPRSASTPTSPPASPAFTLVGLPDGAVKESRDRIRAALATCGFDYPSGRITVSLSPADLPKEGARFDLPIALALLIASGELPGAPLTDSELYGELSLSGEVRPIRGLLSAACAATQDRRSLIIPRENLDEAQLVPGARVAPVTHLSQIAHHLRGTQPLQFISTQPPPLTQSSIYPDLADVRGQTQARRAVEIAAAGDHSLLLVGSPGTGKSMLAQRLPPSPSL